MIVLSAELPDTVIEALDTIAGRYGVNPERKENLKSAGFDPAKVQNCVNDLLALFEKYKNKN